jgi:uncharacterized protein VirK/YbjX
MLRFLDRQYTGKVAVYTRTLLPYCGRRKAAKFFLSAMTHPSLYATWFDYCETRLPKGVHSNTLKHCVEHTTRRYLRRWFAPKEKMELLRCHYDLFGARFSSASLERMQGQDGILLGELVGKSGHRYQMTFYQSMTKEGELVFRFTDSDLPAELATLRGTFGPGADGRAVFWVGAIQGPPQPSKREIIAHATRDLSVLRPKQAVLHAVCAFCAWMGVETLYAPTHENHVSYNWWRAWLSKHKILSDYDGFWKEFTTQKTSRGDACISLPLPRRKLEDVQPKRRKDWIQRHAHIDALTASAAAALTALAHVRPRLFSEEPAPDQKKDAFMPVYGKNEGVRPCAGAAQTGTAH